MGEQRFGIREWVLAVVAVGLLVGGVVAAAVHDRGGSASLTGTLDEPLREQVEWALAFMNNGTGAAEVRERLAPSFRAAVPPAQFESITEEQIRPLGPFTIDTVVESSGTAASLRLRGKGGTPYTLLIAVEPRAPHRITSLLVQPSRERVAAPKSWSDLDQLLRPVSAEVGFLAAEVAGGECRPVHEMAADRPLAIGSAFKLYVLGALADEIAAGRASWDEPMRIRDDLRVHSSARYGDTPAGTAVSLRDLASAMISVSDNTATDHVMVRVGREAVEAQQAALGMSNPSLNSPFLTTRELTLLKWASPEDTRTRYLAADRRGRLAMLQALPKRGATSADLGGADRPLSVDTLEWFASPNDLCRAHARLQAKGGEVRSILTINPGVPLDPNRWGAPAFKGGSEPGVLAVAWLATRTDGRTFVVVAAFRDAGRQIDLAAAVDAASAGFVLLGKA